MYTVLVLCIMYTAQVLFLAYVYILLNYKYFFLNVYIFLAYKNINFATNKQPYKILLQHMLFEKTQNFIVRVFSLSKCIKYILYQ